MDKLYYRILNRVLELDKDTIEKMNDDDQLVDYGLTSLKAVEVLVMIEEELSIRMEAEDITGIQNMTLGSIKKIIEKYSKELIRCY